VAKPARKSRALSPYRTLAEFAKALGGEPVSTVSGWIRHDAWQWNKRAPWPRDIVPDVLEWRKSELKQGRPEGSRTPSGKLRDVKLQREIDKLDVQIATAKAALAKELGKLVDAEEVEHEWGTVGAVIRSGFENLPAHLVPLALAHGMPHEAAGPFQQQIGEAVTGILRRLSRDGTEDDGGSSAAAVPQPTAA
jgi:hypothetical protein